MADIVSLPKQMMRCIPDRSGSARFRKGSHDNFQAGRLDPNAIKVVAKEEHHGHFSVDLIQVL